MSRLLPVRWFAFAYSLLVVAAAAQVASAQEAAAQQVAPVVRIDAPLPPPAWALLEREVLRANVAACEEFYSRYFDERGFLLCVERWGGDDGPDDAMECCNDWPLIYALGGPEKIRALYEKAWEGHLRQYTLAKTTAVPLATDGMFYKEFHTQFDWLHLGEELTVFNLMGLCNPADAAFERRTRRFAGLYMNEDPQAPNYDSQYKLIRSMFTGSRGPLLRKTTALDWAGDPIEIEHRFKPGHGERNYQEMLAHFEDYTDTVGDHPQNLQATTLAFNAFALTQESKYKAWVLEYVDAWAKRAADNGDILPSNIGLDGTIGGAAGGKWYGGVYGWGFTVKVPQTGELAHRSRTKAGWVGFRSAYLLTGEDRYLDVWRRQIAAINAQRKMEGGQWVYPRMHGDNGWYDWTPAPYSEHALELYCLSQREADAKLVPPTAWLEFLAGKDPEYPVRALQADLARVRTRVAAIRADGSTPDTRLADDPMRLNPASIQGLLELSLGAVHPGIGGNTLTAAVRYFDPETRRPGMPEDVAALVEKQAAEEIVLTLVNINQLEPRRVVLQAGAYGEHQLNAVVTPAGIVPAGGRRAEVVLAPGAGARLTLLVKRHALPPTFAQPWER
jgi:hypothetical protein